MSRNDICVIETFLKYLSILVTVTGQTSLTNLLSYPYPPSIQKLIGLFLVFAVFVATHELWLVANPGTESQIIIIKKTCPMLKRIA